MNPKERDEPSLQGLCEAMKSYDSADDPLEIYLGLRESDQDHIRSKRVRVEVLSCSTNRALTEEEKFRISSLIDEIERDTREVAAEDRMGQPDPSWVTGEVKYWTRCLNEGFESDTTEVAT